jgi:cytochrome c biogenesis protein CcmG/thiol:disulfide interchange protein DsbE
LHLWATWCAACLQELPLVATLARDMRARGIDVYSVSLDDPTERAAAKVARVLAERGGQEMTRTILRMDNPDAFIAHIDPTWEGDIPAFFVYDRAGKLRRAYVGEMTRDVFDHFVGDLSLKPVKK